MIDDYNKIISYISNDTEIIYNELVIINNKINSFQDFLDNMVKYNSDYSYNLELFNMIDGSDARYQKLCDTLFILDRVDYDKLHKEPQYKEMVSFINEIEEKIYEIINSLIQKYNELKDNYANRKKIYEAIIDIINDTSIDANSKKLTDILNSFPIDDDFKNMVINYLNNRMELKEKSDNIHVISKLNSEVVNKVKEYIRIFYKLSITEKNSIISASELVKIGDYDNLMYIVYGFTQDEIIYYVTIYNLLDYFNEYIDIVNDTNDNGKSLTDIMEKINNCLNKLSNIEALMNEKTQEENNNNDARNIVLFLDINEGYDGNIKTTSVIDLDFQNIRDKNDGEIDKDIKNIIRMLNTRFRNMDNIKFRKLGYNANKMIVNHDSSLFKRFNVWCSKGQVNNPVRIPYSILSVSESNKKEIIAKYNLPDDANIYLVYGVFTKKNDDSEYVRITNSRLQKEYDTINFIIKIFKNDFDELSRVRAFKLIDNSLLKLEELSNINKEENVK